MRTHIRITRFLILGAAAAALMTPTSEAAAQSLLERLERRLNESGIVPPAAEEPPVEGEQPAENPGYLGLTADVRDGKLEVLSVRAGGPADQAGIRPGDRLVSAGGLELNALDDLSEVVGRLPAGARVELGVERSGRTESLTVTLAARPGDAQERRDEPLPPPQRAPATPLEARPMLGVRAVPVTPEIQRRYGLIVRQGAVIESLQRGSPADRYGLPVGAAIVAVDGARVDSPDDLAAQIGAARPGDAIELSYYVRDRVYRKQVRLGPDAAAPAVRTERPLLRSVERALGGGNDEVVQQLRAEMARMQDRIDELEQRVRDLERRDGITEEAPPPRREPPPDSPDNDDNADDEDAPELTPAEINPLQP